MSITNQLSTTALCIIIALGCTTIVSASYGSTTTEQQTFIELQQKLSPGPGDVIENLEDYDKVRIVRGLLFVLRAKSMVKNSSVDQMTLRHPVCDQNTWGVKRKKTKASGYRRTYQMIFFLQIQLMLSSNYFPSLFPLMILYTPPNNIYIVLD